MKVFLTSDVFGVQGFKQSLMNVLVHLRKCVDHPYLFSGVEPEPFKEGEHLVESSGKLMILDALLKFLHSNGHKVFFSTLTTRRIN